MVMLLGIVLYAELAEIIRNRRVLRVNDDDIQLIHYDAFGKN